MTLDDLLKQKAELERQIALHQNEARTKALDEIRVLMTQHGLTAVDLASPSKRSGKVEGERVSKPVAAKYKDDQGNSWTGRGLKPKWLTAALAAGKSIDEFAV